MPRCTRGLIPAGKWGISAGNLCRHTSHPEAGRPRKNHWRPATTPDQKVTPDDMDAAATGDLPVVVIATVLGGIVIIAAGYLLLQRR